MNSQKTKKWNRVTFGDIVIAIILVIVSILSFIPFWHIVATTFASPDDIRDNLFLLWPKNFSMEAINYIFSTSTFSRSMLNSIWITCLGTSLSLFMTALMAYPLSIKSLVGRSTWMMVIVITMVFNPGMIPGFLNVKSLGLYDSQWALILPGLIVPYNLILMKNFFQSLPESLRESARIEGANDLQIFFKIILPLSRPVLATVALFYAVGYWNNYIGAVLFLDDSSKWPVQMLLRNIVINSNTDLGNVAGSAISSSINITSLKSATIFVSTIPILLVYPFLQKHFTKGLMMGSVKG